MSLGAAPGPMLGQPRTARWICSVLFTVTVEVVPGRVVVVVGTVVVSLLADVIWQLVNKVVSGLRLFGYGRVTMWGDGYETKTYSDSVNIRGCRDRGSYRADGRRCDTGACAAYGVRGV
jgi:hypothetical protein